MSSIAQENTSSSDSSCDHSTYKHLDEENNDYEYMQLYDDKTLKKITTSMNQTFKDCTVNEGVVASYIVLIKKAFPEPEILEDTGLTVIYKEIAATLVTDFETNPSTSMLQVANYFKYVSQLDRKEVHDLNICTYTTNKRDPKTKKNIKILLTIHSISTYLMMEYIDAETKSKMGI